MTKDQLRNIEIPGEVVDIKDPQKKGRVRIKVTSVYDKLEIDDIPWSSPLKDSNGKTFNRPDIGQIVDVRFEDGDIYRPYYSFAEHYNINLQEKLESLSESEYSNFQALHFDDSLQMYKDDKKMIIDFNMSNISMDDNGNISINLRDNKSILTVGSPDSSQEAMLGTHWLSWFDDFIQTLLTTSFFGNSGAPVVAQPQFIQILQQYSLLRNNFVSEHVFITDNKLVKKQDRINKTTKGDAWKSTIKDNNLTFEYKEPYVSAEREDNVISDYSDNGGAPPTEFVSIEVEGNISPKKPIKGNYKNGKIPLNTLKTNKFLSRNLKGGSAKLVNEASDSFDRMMTAYYNSTFKGKQKIVFTDGYRTYKTQIALKKKYGSGAGGRWYVNNKKQKHSYTPTGISGEIFKATSNHGWGLAVDMWWGVQTKYRKTKRIREVVFRHPVYKWFFINGPKFGWYNPATLRDNKGVDEWWHWEYKGKVIKQNVIDPTYGRNFDFVADLNYLKEKANIKWKEIS